MHPWLTILLLVCATSTISVTVTKSKVSEPFRAWLAKHSQWLGKLFSCPYCFSHWTAFGLVFLSNVRVFPNYFVNFAILSFAIVSLATVLSAVMGRLFFMHEDEIYNKNRRIKELEALVKEFVEAQD